MTSVRNKALFQKTRVVYNCSVCPVANSMDWYGNIHVYADPLGIFSNLTSDDFTDAHKGLFAHPFVDQQFDREKWLKWRNGISASEVANALALGNYKSQSVYMLEKLGWREKEVVNQSAVQHGHDHELECLDLYCRETRDVAFKMGSIRHPDPAWSFLTASPDAAVWKGERLVEIKCPSGRNILPTLDVLSYQDMDDDQEADWHGAKLIARAIMRGADCKTYLAINHLPIRYSFLFDKLSDYYHQIQLQAEVARIGNQVDFVQYGTAPNRNYKLTSLLTITQVPIDDTWLSQHGPKLRAVWDDICYYADADRLIADMC